MLDRRDIRSEIASPNIVAVRCVFTRTIPGITEQSTTRSLSIPRTRLSSSTTECGSSAAPDLLSSLAKPA
jgi:hypothetical protein